MNQPTITREQLAAMKRRNPALQIREVRGITGEDLKKRKPRHRPGEMNGLEKSYAEYLARQKLAGDIKDFKFESIAIIQAYRKRYTPDFMVVTPEGRIEFHETKGWMRDDARDKIKQSAQDHPEFDFYIVRKDPEQGWDWEYVNRRGE